MLEEYVELHLLLSKNLLQGFIKDLEVVEQQWCCSLLGGVAVLGVTSSIILAPQTGVWQGPRKTAWTAAPCKEGRGPQNMPVTVDSAFSSGNKLKAKFCFWLRSTMGNKAETNP